MAKLWMMSINFKKLHYFETVMLFQVKAFRKLLNKYFQLETFLRKALFKFTLIFLIDLFDFDNNIQSHVTENSRSLYFFKS